MICIIHFYELIILLKTVYIEVEYEFKTMLRIEKENKRQYYCEKIWTDDPKYIAQFTNLLESSHTNGAGKWVHQSYFKSALISSIIHTYYEPKRVGNVTIGMLKDNQ